MTSMEDLTPKKEKVLNMIRGERGRVEGEEEGEGDNKGGFEVNRDISLVWVSCPNYDDEAVERMIHESLSKGLAAVANKIPGVETTYFFNGKIEKSAEQVVIFKTSAHLSKELGELISSLHPYDAPEVFTIKVDNGNHAFFDTIRQYCRPQNPSQH
eukprot:TRINITY_DN2137_c0_g1_i1.p1 TRINITY_DN2137_c0_g1~~TRINITY_DN2137_c0_g1_i1.p1  ORF type:complete len:156 (+),score=69.92 TRINITY_DN2137_c0_g1_i1:315-782(+)